MIIWKIQLLFMFSKLMLTANGENQKKLCPLIPTEDKPESCVLDEIKNLGDKNEACVDFSKFVCKNWADGQTLKNHEKKRSRFSSIIFEINQLLIGHMEKDNYADPVLIKAQKFYKMCMNEDAVKCEGSLQIEKKLKDFEGYPFKINNIKASKWQNIFEKMINFGFNDNVFVSVDVDKSLGSKETIIYIEQGNLVFERMNNVDKLMEDYKTFIKNSAKELGGTVPSKEEIQKIFDIEQKISKIRRKGGKPAQWINFFKSIPVKELQINAKNIRWTTLLNSLTGIDVDENTVIGTRTSLEYFQKLSEIIKDAGDRNIMNYLNFRFIYYSMNKRTVHSLAYNEFKKKLAPRNMFCIEMLKEGPLKVALSHIFAKNYFSNKSRRFIKDKSKKIGEKLIKSITDSDWLSESVKQEMLAKLKKMKTSVGYSNKDVNLTFLNEYSEEIKPSKTSYFENFYLVEKQRKRDLKKKLNNDMRLWLKTPVPFVVNARYNAYDNIEIYTAGILQGILYNENRIRPMNDGAGALLVGHEKSHAIDSVSQNINSEGIKTDWWDKSTKNKFDKRVKCLMEIYSNITLEGSDFTMNASKIHTEAVADNIAIKHIYAAFKDDLDIYDSQSRKDIEEKYGFTLEQLFWISLGQVFCTKFGPGQLEKFLDGNYYHPTGNVRINGFTMNSEDFAKDFNCPVTSAMNIENRCIIY